MLKQYLSWHEGCFGKSYCYLKELCFVIVMTLLFLIVLQIQLSVHLATYAFVISQSLSPKIKVVRCVEKWDNCFLMPGP